MKYLNILLIILPFIFSCSSDTPENDKEKIPPYNRYFYSCRNF